jgi:hypothetical protein
MSVRESAFTRARERDSTLSPTPGSPGPVADDVQFQCVWRLREGSWRVVVLVRKPQRLGIALSGHARPHQQRRTQGTGWSEHGVPRRRRALVVLLRAPATAPPLDRRSRTGAAATLIGTAAGTVGGAPTLVATGRAIHRQRQLGAMHAGEEYDHERDPRCSADNHSHFENTSIYT